jgi:hypothetical protein
VPLLAYCIAPLDHPPPPGLTGVAGAAVTSIGVEGGLSVWLSDSAGRLTPDPAHVRAYNAVVASAMDHRVTPVPLRFGQAFPDAAAAAGAIAEEAGRWNGLLQRFAGHAEYGVRVRRSAGPARDVRERGMESGRAYMAALAERHAEDERRAADSARLAETVLEAAGSLVAEARQDPLREPGGVAALAHLVAWHDADAYHASMQRIRDAHEGLEFLFTGPWPPYSFVP